MTKSGAPPACSLSGSAPDSVMTPPVRPAEPDSLMAARDLHAALNASARRARGPTTEEEAEEREECPPSRLHENSVVPRAAYTRPRSSVAAARAAAAAAGSAAATAAHQPCSRPDVRYTVVSRWGRVQHELGCPCKPCCSQRRARGGAAPSAGERAEEEEALRQRVAKRAREASDAAGEEHAARAARARQRSASGHGSPALPTPEPTPEPTPTPRPQHWAAPELTLRPRRDGAQGPIALPGPLTVRMLLRAGAFAGRAVEYRARSGKVLLTGTILADGTIEVVDSSSSGAKRVLSASNFEIASGSKERRPAAGICLPTGRSLRDICDALNVGLGHASQPPHVDPAQEPAQAQDLQQAEPLPALPLLPEPVAEPEPAEPCEPDVSAPPPCDTASDDEAGVVYALPPSCAEAAEQVPEALDEREAQEQPRRRAAAVAAALAVSAQVAFCAPTSGVSRDNGKHKRLFHTVLQQGQRLFYITSSGCTLAQGTVSGNGIACECGCASVWSCSAFEAHVGRGSRRAPYDSIFTEQGLNLRQLAASMACDEKRPEAAVLALRPRTQVAASPSAAARPGLRAAFAAPTGRARGPARAAAAAQAASELAAMATRALSLSADTCAVCAQTGHLMLCAACPAAFHPTCAGIAAPPPGRQPWVCEACACAGVRPCPPPSGVSAPLAAVALRCQRLLSDLDSLAGGCSLCRCADFLREGFGPRTMLLCDQCEREYHVACLAQAGRGHLTALPPGDWFCHPGCARVAEQLKRTVELGDCPLPLQPRYSLHLLQGAPPGDLAARQTLASVQRVLSDSFDPILDVSTGEDLLPLMVAAGATRAGEHEFAGMHACLLRCGGQPVSAAVLRVFGSGLAELPLVATASNARRQGHCAVLLRALEDLLVRMGVRRVALPAAHEVERMWTSSFGFTPMPEEQLRAARAELRILVFPGARMLCKVPVRSKQAAGRK